MIYNNFQTKIIFLPSTYLNPALNKPAVNNPGNPEKSPVISLIK